MPTYTLPDLERHWEASVRSFVPELPSCHALFEQLPKTASSVTTALAGRRLLATNCAYLLLAKSLNHAFATYVLLQRSLLVDAALPVRNTLETLLLLELLSARVIRGDCGRRRARRSQSEAWQDSAGTRCSDQPLAARRRMRTSDQQICGQLQSGHSLRPRDRREMIQETLEGVAGDVLSVGRVDFTIERT